MTMYEFKKSYPIIKEIPDDALQVIVDFLGNQKWNNNGNDYANLRECIPQKMRHITPCNEPYKLIFGVFNKFINYEKSENLRLIISALIDHKKKNESKTLMRKTTNNVCGNLDNSDNLDFFPNGFEVKLGNFDNYLSFEHQHEMNGFRDNFLEQIGRDVKVLHMALDDSINSNILSIQEHMKNIEKIICVKPNCRPYYDLDDLMINLFKDTTYPKLKELDISNIIFNKLSLHYELPIETLKIVKTDGLSENFLEAFSNTLIELEMSIGFPLLDKPPKLCTLTKLKKLIIHCSEEFDYDQDRDYDLFQDEIKELKEKGCDIIYIYILDDDEIFLHNSLVASSYSYSYMNTSFFSKNEEDSVIISKTGDLNGIFTKWHKNNDRENENTLDSKEFHHDEIKMILDCDNIDSMENEKNEEIKEIKKIEKIIRPQVTSGREESLPDEKKKKTIKSIFDNSVKQIKNTTKRNTNAKNNYKRYTKREHRQKTKR
jgi:hypothetical protein